MAIGTTLLGSLVGSLANKYLQNTAAGASSGYSSINPYKTDTESPWTYTPGKGYSFPTMSYGSGSTKTTTTPTYATDENNNRVQQDGSYEVSSQPQMMSYEAALAQAQSRLNPKYDSTRLAAEQAYAKEREETPQYAAARYGMAGLHRAGGVNAQKDQVTQKEAAAIDELENQRESAIADLASNIQQGDYSSALQAWQAAENLKAAKAQTEATNKWNAVKMQMDKDENERNWLYKLFGLERDDEQNALAQSNTDREYSLKEKQYSNSPEAQPWYWDYYKTGMDLDNQIKQRTVNQPYARSGSGGSSGFTPYQQYEILRNANTDKRLDRASNLTNDAALLERAKLLAEDDPRINQDRWSDGWLPWNDAPNWTKADIVDAFYQQLKQQQQETEQQNQVNGLDALYALFGG